MRVRYESVPSKQEVCDCLLTELQKQGPSIPHPDMFRLLSTVACLLCVYDGDKYEEQCNRLVKICVLYDVSTWERIACSSIDDESAMAATMLFAVIRATLVVQSRNTAIYNIVADKGNALQAFCCEICDNFEDEVKHKVESGLQSSIIKCVGLASVTV